MSTVFITTRAEADMDEAWLYISRDRPSAANRFIDRLIAHYALLAANPEMGETCLHLGRDIRRSTVGNYVVLFRPRSHCVEILRVIHGARDVEAEFRKHWS